MKEKNIDIYKQSSDELQSAYWIGGAGNMFCRKTFSTKGEIHSATISIIVDSHSYREEFHQQLGKEVSPDNWLLGGSFIKYRLFINNSQIGIGPVRAIITGMPVVHFYDVTAYITDRDNVIGIISRGESRGVALVLQLKYKDGSEENLITDDSWSILDGNAVFRTVCWESQNIYWMTYGSPGPGEWSEHLDGRKFPYGWLDSHFVANNWQTAKKYDQVAGNYELINPKINYSLSKIHPKKIKQLAPDSFLIDFGREIIGGIELSLPDNSSEQLIELRLGEELLSNGRVRFQLRTGNRYQEKWLFKDNGGKLAHFGIRAFRYAEVVNWPNDLSADAICAIKVNAPFEWSKSDFSCSDQALKQVWDFCKFSIAATSLDIYMDCPSRERLAYEADAYVTMLSHFSVENNLILAKRTFEYQLNHATWPCEWRQLSIPLAYEYLMQSGDYDCVDKYYDHLKNKCSFHQLIDRDKGLIKEFPMRILIDWPPVYRNGYEEHEYTAVPNAFAYYDLILLHKLARLLNQPQSEIDYWLNRSIEIKAAFNNILWDDNSGLYRDSQMSNHCSFHAAMYALRFDLVPDDKITKVLNFIIKKGMVCSPYTAQFYLETLFIHNRAEFAVELMTSTDTNSWLNMIKQGATVTMESWTPEHKPNLSWAHPWATSPANIIARHLFGLRATVPGWQKYDFKPSPGGIKQGKLTLPTPQGELIATFVAKSGGAYDIAVKKNTRK